MSFKKIFFVLLVSVAVLHPGGFDDLGYSARSVGMGGTGVALPGTPSSLFYNPANIYSCKDFVFTTNYSNLFPGVQDDKITYMTASGIIPMSFIGSLGAGVTFLHTDLWKEYSLHATYVKELFDGFAVGGAVKYLGWSAGAAEGEKALSYNGFTFDAGAVFVEKRLIQNALITVGVSAQNLTEPSIASSGNPNGSKLPLRVAGGIAYTSLLYDYTGTVDILKENDVLWLKTGAEFLAYKGNLLNLPFRFIVRGGYYEIMKSDFSKAAGLNGGFGISIDNYVLDYAYQYPKIMEAIGGAHKISLSFKI